jgi:hypothetical protein
MQKIETYEQYLSVMQRLDLLFFTDNRTDEEDLELLELSKLSEDWELLQGI